MSKVNDARERYVNSLKRQYKLIKIIDTQKETIDLQSKLIEEYKKHNDKLYIKLNNIYMGGKQDKNGNESKKSIQKYLNGGKKINDLKKLII